MAETMNKHERIGGEAKVEFLDSTIRILSPGTFVACGVTGKPIALDQLRYWSVERQEAYAHPEAILERLRAKRGDTR
jgi:hypothetical protein